MKPIRLISLAGASVGAALAAGSYFQPVARDGGTATDSAAVASAAQGQSPELLALLRADEALPGAGMAHANGCDPAPGLVAAPRAMLTLSLTEPCLAGETVTIIHGPLRLTEQLGPEGTLVLTLPAMAPEAEVMLSLADGTTRAVSAPVPDFADHARLLIRWDGAAVMDLHAYIGEAEWGDEGHVHVASAMSMAEPHLFGFVTAVDSGAQHRIRTYTWPTGHSPYDAAITVEAELAITEANCGKSMQVEALLIRAAAPVGRQLIDIAVPDCAAAGGYLLLQGLVPADTLPAEPATSPVSRSSSLPGTLPAAMPGMRPSALGALRPDAPVTPAPDEDTDELASLR